MSQPDHVIAIKVLDRSFKVKCPPEQAAELQESAKLLDDQMRKIRASGNMGSLDRVAVVAALNISHELLQVRKHKNRDIAEMHGRITELHRKINTVLAEEEPAEL